MQTHDIKPKILYVDDEEGNLLVFKSSFRRNYDVLTALSAGDGMNLLKDNSVDIIISDQRMEGITGIDFIKSLPKNLNTINMILSGYSDVEVIIEAINSGSVYQYIKKPWSKDELMIIIEKALEAHKTSNLQVHSMDSKINAHYESDHQNNKAIHPETENNIEKELVKSNQENASLKKQIDEIYTHVHLLSELGQEIISNFSIESIIESTYENVNSLMDATFFYIGIIDEQGHNLEFPGGIEKGEKMEMAYDPLNELRLSTWCFLNNEEVIIQDYFKDYSKYIPENLPPTVGEIAESLIYLPLIIEDQPIGVITVQSLNKNAYSNNHIKFLRNIAIYVATALRNAKAYNLIETQKLEIEQKNIDLEVKVKQRTRELEEKSAEILKKHSEVEATYRKVKLLSEIGQKITSTLSLDKIIETVYDHVNNLMDVTIFSIGIYNPILNRIEFPGSMENGKRLPPWFATMDEENRLAVNCFKNQKEIIINDYEIEYNKYISSIVKPKAGELPESIIYMPLMSNEGPIGTISVQSFKKHVYNHYHLDILGSLASYISIALQNAASYRKTTQAFEDLKSAQMKLVEAEKMASLGIMTAGVAHEINNPVNFISAGIESLSENYNDFKTLVNKFLAFDGHKPDEKLWLEIEELKNKLSPTEMLEEMDELLSTIKNGARRTSEIVKGLRNFSRLDENEMKLANLEEGIDSTLVILNNQVKDRIEIIRAYGNIPEILCYPGQLNQVFMNILHNATQAIEGKGEIRIITEKVNNDVCIRFKDNGSGMPEEVRSHIFDPFFTTKAVGKGTGLGLSIAYGIIEKHNGTIEVKSEPGKGTEFIISLPVKI